MMRNKLFTGLAAVAIFSLFFGCASTDDGVKEVVFDSNDTNIEEPENSEEQEINESDALLVTTDEESAYKIETTTVDCRSGYGGRRSICLLLHPPHRPE